MDELAAILKKYWGYDSFRPLQAEAMRAVVEGRDSVVVLPTGGGKSLCFQAPAVHLPGLAVVISPLISLMKDQVDTLVDCGVPAACVNSTLSFDERRRVAEEIRSGRLKLLYLSPERLMTERTLEFLRGVPLSFIAIDEAHCISEWGHDFRPEYRMLRQLKGTFPGVAIHAYTATATPAVREDIARELALDNPAMLVGSFDRPNLVYRVQRRSNLLAQIRAIIDRHRDESGLVYCMRRADVESITAGLQELGLKALPYHAGMSDEDRRKNQDAFISDRAQIIVATVAFGMGIDKPDVRFVIHAAAPKSLEAYQQESGRAGRDGLEAECWLFHSGGDFASWRQLLRDLPEHAYGIAMQVLGGIEGYTRSTACRHRALVEYFGQEYRNGACGACDVCLDELDLVADPLVIAQKILSCVVRVEERFGADYVSLVLTGSKEQRILDHGHQQLSTWGLLSEHPKKHVRDWIEQLAGQGFVEKFGEYGTLSVTQSGRRLLRGDASPSLLRPAGRPKRESRAEKDSWQGVDRGLFDALRALRSEIAGERGVPPFIVFGDATLRDLARRRPTTDTAFLEAHGVGEKKLAAYGEQFLEAIREYCEAHDVETDVVIAASEQKRSAAPAPDPQLVSGKKKQAFDLFREGKTAEDVCAIIDRAPSTVAEYLADFITRECITDPRRWIAEATYHRVRAAVDQHGDERLKPIFDELSGEVSYEEIRIAVRCLQNEARAAETDLAGA